MKVRDLIFAAVSFVLVSSVLLFAGCGSDDTVMSHTGSATAEAEKTDIQIADTTTEVLLLHTEDSTDAIGNSPVEEAASEAEETTASAMPVTPEEIVAYFNESANKIKTSSKKVVKNYEKRTVNEDKLDIPDAIESTARTMMTSLMKDDTDPIVYETREEITDEFPVPGQSYVSVLKAEYVEEAVCTDNGNEYIIHIRLKDSKNPTAGKGVGSVCDVIETAEVAEKASFIKSFSTDYSNCEVIATVDKASGNVTHIKYITPVVLALTVDMFGTHSGQVGFTFEKDYSITY